MCSWWFCKYRKMQKLRLFFKSHKIICHKQTIKSLVFFKLARLVCNHMNFNPIKTTYKTLNFCKKIIFAFLNPKFLLWLKILLKHCLNLVHWNAHNLGKKSFQYHKSLVRKKMKLKSGHLELRFSVYTLWDILTLKEPITTAADDKFCDVFPNFRQKEGMIFHENCLSAEDSHEQSCLICYFWKAPKFKIIICWKL